MTRIATALTFVAILIACLAGTFTSSWWLACGLAAFVVPAALTQRRPAYTRAAPQRQSGTPRRALAASTTLVAAALDLALGLTVGFAIGRTFAWALLG